jgi:hypothetical protein
MSDPDKEKEAMRVEYYARVCSQLDELVRWRNNRAGKGWSTDTLDSTIALLGEFKQMLGSER